ncbi:MAG TPA: YrdB family protein [Chitinophagales bacterium]|nr:YrdB family protein [Chitinophagales bacterium]
MNTVKIANALLAFSLELGMLAAFAYWGYKNGNGLVGRWMLAIGIPIVVAMIWGLILAPKAPYRLDTTFRVLVELTLFLLAAFALYRLGHVTLALMFAALSVLCQLIFLFVGEWKP